MILILRALCLAKKSVSNKNKRMQLSDLNHYAYDLPERLIRKKGVEPRDSARLFVYDTRTDTVTLDTFSHLAKYLPERSLIVLNNTKVLPVRLWLHKETGGKIEVFVLANQIEDEHRIPVLVDRKVSLGQKLLFPNGDYLEVVDQEENLFFVKLVSGSATLSGEVLDHLYTLLEMFGETPLPHYLEGADTSEDVLRKRYQTVFAREGASVAAPTASLHFTEQVFQSLEEKRIETVALTLNVGLGTFAPLREEHFVSGTLHAEHVNVSRETARLINEAKAAKRDIVSVGTTTTRTLEYLMKQGEIKAYSGKTDMFIYPPYEFQAIDHLITNFHLPKSSLMLLVDAFLQYKKAKRSVMELYAVAIENDFAFYSFGDSMLIL